jgi:hypothetical protein
MSVFSEIDIDISQAIVSGDTSSKIVETLVREHNLSQKFAQELIDNHIFDYQNDYESKFEIEYD